MSQLIGAVADRVAPWRGADWGILVGEGVSLVLVSLLLLYRVATNNSIAGLLAVTSWLVLGTGIALALLGVMRLSKTGVIDASTADSPTPA